jgi:predicted  nucleic acid-binding Zn-ribbon protein
MEDWQEWQIRADRIAAELNAELDVLDKEFFGDGATANFRSFWPRFRDLKERVRIAPAIKLEDKLDLEKRLRGIGSKAYKAQEAAFGRSSNRKDELLARVAELRAQGEAGDSPRALRSLRREIDALRKEFDSDRELVAADRQAIWDAWREANQFVWDRLNALWSENEAFLREALTSARQNLERGNGNAARTDVRRFFESLRTHEAKQETINALKAEADAIRREAEDVEERRQTARMAASTPSIPSGNPVGGWRSELERNRESVARLTQEAAELERQVAEATSVLQQAMVRGSLVEKRRKITELERANRALEQRIGQTEETPLIPSA